jgi:hypothetical protein
METTSTKNGNWKLQQVVFADILAQLNTHFTALEIDYMPIKGAFLICSGLAVFMTHRRMDDIDILVKPADFEKARSYFFTLDNVEKRGNYWPFEASFFYRSGQHRVYVELHHQLNFRERFLLPAEDLFYRGRKTQEHVTLPDPEDAMLILLCHALVHIGFEFRENWFEEISLISRQPDFSWEEFWKRAPETGIEGFLQYMAMNYAMELGDKKCLPVKRKIHPVIITAIMPLRRHERIPFWVRRIFLEAGFVREPFSLLTRRITKRRGA